MGLYAKARKLIEALEKEKGKPLPLIDFSARGEQESTPEIQGAVVDPLAKKISSDIDHESRFVIIGINLKNVIDGIALSSPESKKSRVTAEVLAFITKASSSIAHPYQVDDERMVLVIQSPDSVDLELLVHQIYSGLRNFFAGCPGESCTIFRSRARTFPIDGNDVRSLIQAVI